MKAGIGYFLPTAGKRLGDKYVLLEILGDGTHGWVFRAQRLSDDEIVAVKIPKELSRDDSALAEGKELLGVPGHPNVVRILDMGRVPPGREWYAIEMEYFPSESLAQKLEQRSHHFGNTYLRLFDIYTQVLEAVAFLASLEPPISHGDIKPHNVLVGEGGKVKLTDFGSSALPDEIYLRTRENGGTVLYAAPEFSDCTSRKGSFVELLRGDIYSLGVMLYQLTTGELPHNTQAQVRRHAPFPKPSEVNQRISPVLEKVILTCLRRDPGERFPSVGALQDAFSQASRHQLEYEPTPHLSAADQGTIDWSTEVLQAMEQGHFGRAARAAEQERKRSGDINALALQLNALFRDKRWTAFASLFEEVATTTELDGDSGAGIRLQAIRVYLKLRDLDKASSLLEASRVNGEMCLEQGLCEASIAGMQAKYENARALLEDLNRSFPRNIQVLSRLVQVCEQQRDYQASAGFLRVALKLSPNDEKLSEKRNRYQALGAW